MTLYEKILSVVGMLRASISGKVSKTDFAPEFNPTASYSVGRIVMYDGKLYECIVAHSGTWDPDHFSYTTMARVVESKGRPQVQSNWSETDKDSAAYIRNKPELAAVATSGSYNDLGDKPEIPEPVSQVQSDWDVTDENSPAFIKNKPSMSIDVDDELSGESENPVQNKVITEEINALENTVGHKASKNDIAADFDEAVMYSPGTLVVKDDVIYTCISDHIGQWNPNDFAASTVNDVLGKGYTGGLAYIDYPSMGYCMLKPFRENMGNDSASGNVRVPPRTLINNVIRNVEGIDNAPDSAGAGNNAMKSIVAGSGLTYVGNGAFARCANLTSVSLPGVTSIGQYAFTQCGSLIDINLPAAEEIGQSAFYSTGITDAHFPNLTYAGTNVFQGCSNLKNVYIPKLGAIPEAFFAFCSSLEVINFGGENRAIPSITSKGGLNSGVPKSCVIVVPDARYDAWVSNEIWAAIIADGFRIIKHSEYVGVKQTRVNSIGMLKGEGNGRVASAVPGTDYVAPGTLQVSGILKGDGSGAVSSAIAGTDYVAPGSLRYDIMDMPESGQLFDRTIHKLRLTAASKTLTLPATTPGKVCDFFVDIVNAYKPGASYQPASINLSGELGVDYLIVTPYGENFGNMCELAPAEYSRFYFTLTSFYIVDGVNTWLVIKSPLSVYSV